jgi:hypothetical protein
VPRLVPEGRIVVEVARGRRIVREYDATGALVRIRIEPTTRGETPDLPPLPPPAPVAVKARRKPAPPREEPKSAPAADTLPPPVPVAEPATPPVPPPIQPRRGFKVLREDVLPPPPPPDPVAEPPERFPVELAVEKALEPVEEVAIAPPVAAEPEPAAPPPSAQPELESVPEPPVAEPEAAAPPEPRRFEVPDLEKRVDELLAKGPPRRKRAPVPVPQFEPLRREPWEDRLDAALRGAA